MTDDFERGKSTTASRMEFEGGTVVPAARPNPAVWVSAFLRLTPSTPLIRQHDLVHR